MRKILTLCLCLMLAALCVVCLSGPVLADAPAVGDLDEDGYVNNRDVEFLLWHTLFPEEYPLSADADFDQDGSVNNRDVEFLLWHTLFPEEYPLPEAPHTHSYDPVITPPTATKDGFTTYTCSCGDSYVDDYVPAVGIGELKFSGASLVLMDDLTVRFSADANLFITDAYTQPYAVFHTGSKIQTVTDYEISGGKYIFSCTNLAPSQAGDTITAELHATLNGEEETFSIDYSVARYCYDILEETDNPTLRTLLVDLLNYGAAAQVYSWYKDKTLCNADLTAEQKAWGTTADPVLTSHLDEEYETVENPKAVWEAAGLVLDHAITMRFRFTAENIENLIVKIRCDDQEWTISSFEASADKENQYYAYFNGLTARQMRQVVYVTVYEGDTAVSNTITYSMETYACNKQDEPRLGDLVKAMMRYGDSAAAYGTASPLPEDEF